ncbi:uncharacterized protein [Miscanthus floridulus]|uniref:uncharacterized protein n=1 Tax=Miscanthus floridulus TaxID=154761 RepID=UPI0034573BA4
MGTTRLTKVLMDGGSGLNILYANTLEKMGIPPSSLCPNKASLYEIIPGKEVMPLGHFRLNVTFGQLDNFRKEPLTFKVVYFPGVYHCSSGPAMLFQVNVCPQLHLPKLKMPSPKGFITVEGSFKQAYYCE